MCISYIQWYHANHWEKGGFFYNIDILEIVFTVLRPIHYHLWLKLQCVFSCCRLCSLLVVVFAGNPARCSGRVHGQGIRGECRKKNNNNGDEAPETTKQNNWLILWIFIFTCVINLTLSHSAYSVNCVGLDTILVLL